MEAANHELFFSVATNRGIDATTHPSNPCLPAGRHQPINPPTHPPISPQDTHIVNLAKRELPDPETHSFYMIKVPVIWEGRAYRVEFQKKRFEGIEKWVYVAIHSHAGRFKYPTMLLY